jgi:glutathionylspermidine synthase
VKRLAIAPRPGWQAEVERAGLLWHTAGGEPYWNESACYVFRGAEIEAIAAATAELHRLCLAAGQAILDRDLFGRFGIPPWVVPLIRRAWEEEPPALYHGRFDLGYDGRNPPKLFEYNCDTPTALFEAAVVQWEWKEAVYPHHDQYNSLHESLVAKWRQLAPLLPGKMPGKRVHFTHVDDEPGEDTLTVTYLRDTAEQGGVATAPILIEDVGWDSQSRRFVDLENRPIDTLFHLYPWEWLVHEELGPRIAESYDAMLWIEPIWKMLWSNKALLAVLWELFPGHPNLLAASFEPLQGGCYVRKPLLAREGANVQVVKDGATLVETPGDYGHEGYVYQDLYELPDFAGQRPVLGSWIVDGEPAGLGLREGGLVTGNTGRFVPHIIED